VLKRQVFEAFCLEVRYDKPGQRMEVSATISEAAAQAFENGKRPPAGGLSSHSSRVTLRDIAGARFDPQSDARVVERMRPAA